MIDFLAPFTQRPVEIYPHRVDTDAAELAVVIVAYRHEDYIQQCLDSVLEQQTNFPFYIFLAEDDSPDATRAICQRYAQRYPDRIVMAMNHRGNNIALNGRPSARHNFLHALSQVKGKYVCLFEGDDFWNKSNKIQLQYDYLESHPDCNLVYTDSAVLNESDRKLRSDVYNSPNAKTFDWRDSLLKKQGPSLTLMYRRSALPLPTYAGLIQETAMGDWPMEVLLTLNGNGHRINVVTSTYRRRDGGSTLMHLARPLVYFSSRIGFLERLLDTDLPDSFQRRIIQQLLRRLYWLRSAEHFALHQFKDCRADLRASFFGCRSSKAEFKGEAQLPKERPQFKWFDRFTTKKIFKTTLRYYYAGFKRWLRPGQ